MKHDSDLRIRVMLMRTQPIIDNNIRNMLFIQKIFDIVQEFLEYAYST